MLARKISKRIKAIVALASSSGGAAMVLVATFVWPGLDLHPQYDFAFTASIMIAILPAAVVDAIDRMWRSNVNSKISDFVRDIAEVQKTGLTYTRAIENATTHSFGYLTPELKRVRISLSWGSTTDEALTEMANRIDTNLVHRIVAILNEVGRSGARLYEILELVYTHIKEIEDLEKERKRALMPYVMTIYAAFGVFLFVVLILFKTFFNVIGQQIEQGGSVFLASLNPKVYFIWFYHMSVVESMIGGFVAGKMAEGTIIAGLKHVLIMLALTLVIFAVAI